MNNIINTAVDKVNEQRHAEAVRKAQQLAEAIEAERKSRAAFETQIGETRKAIVKITESQITYEAIMGAGKPATPTASQETVIKAIDKLVEQRQSEVASKALALGQDITSKLGSIAAIDKRIEELRTEVARLAPDLIEASTLVG